mmetsp:Transcript_33905/g.84937  ORF Transcript_33905/g.84937 Transcript_33905/m.84937 type:complete len:581 (-) Transcript_33905:28-1770(-)
METRSSMRVEHPQLRVRRRAPPAQLHRQLERAGQPGTRLRVPRVCLQAAHRHRPAATPPTARLANTQNRRHRARLDWVAQRRPRAVRLERRCALRRHQPRVGPRRHEHAALRLPVGCRQARAPPVLPHRAARRRHSPPDLQTTSDRVDRLAARVAVGAHVKRMRAAAHRREARCRVASHRRRVEDHVDARAQRRVALAPLQPAHARVVRDERRRARRVDRGARALQPERKRHAPAGDRAREARRCVHAASRGRARQHARKLARPLADADRDRRAHEPAAHQARRMQRRVAALEQLPLLRVHRRRLGRRDAKAAMLKQLGAPQEAAVAHAARHLWRAALQVARRLLHVPPRRRDDAQQVAAAQARDVQRAHARHAARQRRAHARQPHLCVAHRLQPRIRPPLRTGVDRAVALQVERQLSRGGVIEHHRARQRRAAARRPLQLVAQLDRAQRVDARLHQRRVGVDRAARRAPHHLQHRPKRRCRHVALGRCHALRRFWRHHAQQRRCSRATAQHAIPSHRQHGHARRRSRQDHPVQRFQPERKANPAKAARRLDCRHPLARRAARRHPHLGPRAPLHAHAGS